MKKIKGKKGVIDFFYVVNSLIKGGPANTRIISAAAKIITAYGPTLMPGVSSSKNLIKPAPVAGIAPAESLDLLIRLIVLNSVNFVWYPFLLPL